MHQHSYSLAAILIALDPNSTSMLQVRAGNGWWAASQRPGTKVIDLGAREDGSPAFILQIKARQRTYASITHRDSDHPIRIIHFPGGK